MSNNKGLVNYVYFFTRLKAAKNGYPSSSKRIRMQILPRVRWQLRYLCAYKMYLTKSILGFKRTHIVSGHILYLTRGIKYTLHNILCIPKCTRIYSIINFWPTAKENLRRRSYKIIRRKSEAQQHHHQKHTITCTRSPQSMWMGH